MANDFTKTALCGALSRFLDSSDLSDFTITCDSSKWHTHRLVLCLHSDVLAKWTSGEFQEAKEGKADLSGHHHPLHVEALVNYLYTLDYSVDGLEQHTDKMNFHISMCIIADKYNIPGLTIVSTQKFESIVSQTQTAVELAEAALLAYEAANATTVIRQNIVELISKKRDVLLPTIVTEDSAALEEAMRKYPELAIDVVKGKAPTTLKPAQCDEKVYQCGNASCFYQFKAHLGVARHLPYSCPNCTFTANGEHWNKNCVKR